MIEVTDDMVSAYDEASWNNPQASHGAEFPNVREGLAAVLALVERDWNMQPNPAAPRWRCNKVERCFREDGHDGRHAFAGEVKA